MYVSSDNVYECRDLHWFPTFTYNQAGEANAIGQQDQITVMTPVCKVFKLRPHVYGVSLASSRGDAYGELRPCAVMEGATRRSYHKAHGEAIELRKQLG